MGARYPVLHCTARGKSPIKHVDATTPTDVDLFRMGYDEARRRGLLPEYMEMMNRGKSGGYSQEQIAKARGET